MNLFKVFISAEVINEHVFHSLSITLMVMHSIRTVSCHSKAKMKSAPMKFP